MMSTLRGRPRAHPGPAPDGLVERLDAELRARAAREVARARAAHDQAQAAAAAKAARAELHYQSLGMDVGGIAAFHRILANEDAAARMALRQSTALPVRPREGMGLADDRDWIPGSDQHRCPYGITLHSAHAVRRAASARGSGNGWFGSGAQQAWETELWHFAWTPPETGWYTFRPVVAFRGTYIVQAADDFWTSKRAAVAVRFAMHHWQGTWKRDGRPDGGGTAWTRGGANLGECEGMDWEHVPRGDGIHPVPFAAGEPALVSVQLTLHAAARGEGSFAEISAAGDGGYLACRSLLGTYTGPPPLA
ncbi:MAG TPA: hypothetical protein VHG08_02965 [Longimicrobium sp.]|nr:hypothetical protein [Longimicrobium sp.]